MSVKIYVEGGGVRESSLTKCRRGFTKFFAELLRGKNRVRVIPCGGRAKALRDFRIAHEAAKSGEHVILLVDSEGPVEPHVSPWDYLWVNEKDKWEKPKNAEEDQAHLMVQCMEAWFMADREAVVEYFGKRVKISDFPDPVNNDIERIPKVKITDASGKPPGRYARPGEPRSRDMTRFKMDSRS